MSVYLHDIPLSEAQSRIKSALQKAGSWKILGEEEISLDENAIGRVLVEPVWARISSPHYHASAMDGFAVRAEDTDDAMPNQPVVLEYGNQAVYVDTGDPLPDWANAVIPIENIEPLDKTSRLAADERHPDSIRIRSGVTPWSHVRSLGEDIVATQLVLPAGHTLRPVDLGATAACGHSHVKVSRKPRVAILPTGSELLPVGSEVKVGDIIEYNSLVLAAQIKELGGEPVRFPITPDDFDQIQVRVKEAAGDFDLILLNAGSSAGSEDFSASVIESLGILIFHGVAVRPGHPVIFGMLDRKDEDGSDQLIPIFGIPGYPVSAALTGEIFVAPLLSLWIGRKPAEMPVVKAVMTRKVTSPPGDDDFLRVAVGRVGDRLLAAPLSRGAGVITSLVRADGLALLPRGSQGISAGEEVSVRLYRPISQIEKSILAIGSHDMTLDLMAQYLAEEDRRLTSANVGSQGGLVALRREEAHFAGSHLLDPRTGEFNISYIHQYLPGIPVTLVTLVGRQQGLLVLHGNPKGIKSLDDLTREEITFINRQRGAGTRVLLDYHLGLIDISSDDIQGYRQEEYTHLSIAAAVASGKADCGLGIAAAAKALDLDFIPLFEERYDLVIPTEYYEGPLLEPLLKLLEKPEFRRAVENLPGYDTDRMGEVVATIE
jgi:putative molybdopterin biosynthesis protein